MTTWVKKGVGRLDALRFISVRGAEEHNLKGVDLDIPRDALTVVTGVSGSGKSSLAFDTIFAEGQRKYMESLSAYARQFLDQQKKPKVERIEGLTPTIAIEQRAASRNPRSTVATTTEIFDYLRLLFARIGTPTCWVPVGRGRCGEVITRSSPSRIHASVSALPEGTRLMVLAPVIQGKKGHHREVFESLVAAGFIRARINGEVKDISQTVSSEAENPMELGRYEKHDIDVVVDRLVVRSDLRARLVDSVETALKVGQGNVIISVVSPDGEMVDSTYSEHHACPVHPEAAIGELEPRLFSFNSHYGACPDCQGLGEHYEFDDALCLPDEDLPLDQGGFAPLKRNGPGGMFIRPILGKFSKLTGFPRGGRVGNLTPDQRRILMFGTTPKDEKRLGGSYPGASQLLADWLERSESAWVQEFLPRFQSTKTCRTCHGARLSMASLSVWLESDVELPEGSKGLRKKLALSEDLRRFNIADFTALSIQDALSVLRGVRLTGEHQAIGQPIVREVIARLEFLASVGLNYLSLDRKTATLSGGEAQRIRLASQLGSGIVGATYVLDEPTIGLHARDNDRLIKTLRRLADIGNTVLVVEHDESMIRAADFLVDMGPGPGVHGGTVVASGTAETLAEYPRSLTGQYLSGARSVPLPVARRKLSPKRRSIRIKRATGHNLKGLNINVPLDGMVCVTGVSGSGKSTLVNDTLLQAVLRHLGRRGARPAAHKSVEGLDAITRVVEVDQTPIGRTSRSNPATYTGIFDDIRKLFAMTPDARIRGYKPGRFSFNVKGGRCEACKGQGVKRIAMHFLPDVFVSCDACDGTRYNAETLAVRYKGKSIAEVLDMTFEDARSFFQNHPAVHRMVSCMCDVGLDYLTLGQPSTTLSGGEAQRVKLATELGRSGRRSRRAEHSLFVLDEPTTGLHFEDVRKLLNVLQELADGDASVVIIEHNLDVIKAADWVIDLGPEGGEGGGRLVAEGTPEDVAAGAESYTGHYLRDLL